MNRSTHYLAHLDGLEPSQPASEASVCIPSVGAKMERASALDGVATAPKVSPMRRILDCARVRHPSSRIDGGPCGDRTRQCQLARLVSRLCDLEPKVERASRIELLSQGLQSCASASRPSARVIVAPIAHCCAYPFYAQETGRTGRGRTGRLAVAGRGASGVSLPHLVSTACSLS